MSDIEPVVVNLFRRDVGFIVVPTNPLGIRDFMDLAKENVRFVNRQQGSGIRVLIDRQLAQNGVDAWEISGYEREVYTHFEIALKVLLGEADVGVATYAAAKLFGQPILEC